MTNLNGRKGFLQLLGGSSIGRGLNFGINILLSRVLGPTELGLFALILSTSQTFEVLSRGGVDYGLTCALTDHKTQDEHNNENELIDLAIKIARVTTLILLIFLVIWLGPGNGLLPGSLDSNRSGIILLTSLICVAESLSALPWDILLVKGKVNIVRLKQGLFTPIKLLVALAGAWLGGIVLALTLYSVMALIQAIWLNKLVIEKNSTNNQSIAKLWQQIKMLVGDGLALYISNSLSALVFLPLLANIANVSGLQSVGFLRVGQIVVQVFTLIPGALAPILFIKARTSTTESRKKDIVEKSLLMIWSLGMGTLLAYIIVDKQIINFFFGNSFLSSLEPTRVLIYIAIMESIGQVLHTSLLAERRVRLFIIVQNSALLISAIVGWRFILMFGLDGFLMSKFIFAILPSLVYLAGAWNKLENKGIIYLLASSSILILPLCWINSLSPHFELLLISMSAALIACAGWRFQAYLKVARA